MLGSGTFTAKKGIGMQSSIVIAAFLGILLAACGGASSIAAQHPKPTVCRRSVAGCHAQATHSSSKESPSPSRITTNKMPSGTTSVSVHQLHTSGSASPSPSIPAPSQQTSQAPVALGPSALGPLQNDLPGGDAQLIVNAMNQLPPSASSQITNRLNGLSSGEAGALAADLSQVLGSDPANAQGYADALVGVSAPSAVQTATNDAMQSFSNAFQSLPGQLSQGISQVAAFVSQILSTTVPYIEQLITNGLSQVPSQDEPLLIAMAVRTLGTVSPTQLGDYTALMEDPTAQQLATETAYQAGLACGATLYNTCTPFDQWVLSVSGLKTAPAPIQQDIVDCLLLPVCSQADYQGVIAWVDQVAANSAVNSISIQALGNEMQANSYAAAQGWIEAF